MQRVVDGLARQLTGVAMLNYDSGSFPEAWPVTSDGQSTSRIITLVRSVSARGFYVSISPVCYSEFFALFLVPCCELLLAEVDAGF